MKPWCPGCWSVQNFNIVVRDVVELAGGVLGNVQLSQQIFSAEHNWGGDPWLMTSLYHPCPASLSCWWWRPPAAPGYWRGSRANCISAEASSSAHRTTPGPSCPPGRSSQLASMKSSQQSCLSDAYYVKGEEDEPIIDPPVVRVPGGTLRDIQLYILVGEGDGWHHVDPQVDKEDDHGGDGQMDVQDHPGLEGEDLRNVTGEGVSMDFFKLSKISFPSSTSVLDTFETELPPWPHQCQVSWEQECHWNRPHSPPRHCQSSGTPPLWEASAGGWSCGRQFLWSWLFVSLRNISGNSGNKINSQFRCQLVSTVMFNIAPLKQICNFKIQRFVNFKHMVIQRFVKGI